MLHVKLLLCVKMSRRHSLGILPFLVCNLRNYGPVKWSFSECWALGQLFHSPHSLSLWQNYFLSFKPPGWLYFVKSAWTDWHICQHPNSMLHIFLKRLPYKVAIKSQMKPGTKNLEKLLHAFKNKHIFHKYNKNCIKLSKPVTFHWHNNEYLRRPPSIR